MSLREFEIFYFNLEIEFINYKCFFSYLLISWIRWLATLLLWRISVLMLFPLTGRWTARWANRWSAGYARWTLSGGRIVPLLWTHRWLWTILASTTSASIVRAWRATTTTTTTWRNTSGIILPSTFTKKEIMFRFNSLKFYFFLFYRRLEVFGRKATADKAVVLLWSRDVVAVVVTANIEQKKHQVN